MSEEAGEVISVVQLREMLEAGESIDRRDATIKLEGPLLPVSGNGGGDWYELDLTTLKPDQHAIFIRCTVDGNDNARLSFSVKRGPGQLVSNEYTFTFIHGHSPEHLCDIPASDIKA